VATPIYFQSEPGEGGRAFVTKGRGGGREVRSFRHTKTDPKKGEGGELTPIIKCEHRERGGGNPTQKGEEGGRVQ